MVEEQQQQQWQWQEQEQEQEQRATVTVTATATTTATVTVTAPCKQMRRCKEESGFGLRAGVLVRRKVWWTGFSCVVCVCVVCSEVCSVVGSV